MKIAISGASGLLGSEVSEFLLRKGHTVVHLVRKTPGSEVEIHWNPISGEIDKEKLENIMISLVDEIDENIDKYDEQTRTHRRTEERNVNSGEYGDPLVTGKRSGVVETARDFF